MADNNIEAELQNIAKVAKKNGNSNNTPLTQELPPERMKAIEYGLAQFQVVGHERDQLRKEAAEQRDKNSSLQITNDGLHSQLSEMQSHLRSAIMIRDQAVADRVKYEALFVSILAQMRAFAVPAEPYIKDHDAE